MTNQFVYRIGSDSAELQGAVDRARQSIDRLTASGQQLEQRLAAITGVSGSLVAANDRIAASERALSNIRAASQQRDRAAFQAEAALQDRRAAAAQRAVENIRATAQQQQRQSFGAEQERARAEAAAVAARAERALAGVRAAAQQAEKKAYQDAQAARAANLRLLEQESQRLGLSARQINEVKVALAGASKEGAALVRQLQQVNTAAAAAPSAGGGGAAALGAGLRAGGALLGVGLGAETVRQSTRAIVDAQVELERLQLQFTAGFGAEKGARELDFVREAANQYGLQLASTGKQYALFAAATRGTSLEGQATREVFLGAAESAAALGLNIEDTEGILRAFGQIASKNRVQLEELSGQLGDRLAGALGKAARALNVTTAELLDMVQRGEVTATDFLPRLARILREDVAESAEAAANRLGAVNVRLENSFGNLKQQLAQSGVGDAYRRTAESLTRDTNQIADALERSRANGNSFFTELARADIIDTLKDRLAGATGQLKALLEQQQRGGDNPAIQRQIEQVEALRGRLQSAIDKQRELGGASVGGGAGPGQRAPLVTRFTDDVQRFRQRDEQDAKRRGALAKVTAELNGETGKYQQTLSTLQASLLAGDFAGKEAEYRSLVLALIEGQPKAGRGVGAGGGDLDKNLKARLDAQLAGIRLALQQEADAFAFAGTLLDGYYEDGVTSLRTYYQDKADVAQAALTAQLARNAQEQAALRTAIPQARDEDTRIRYESDLAEAVQRRADIEVQGARAVAVALREETIARAALQQRIADARIDTLQLRGNEGEAERLRNQQQVAGLQQAADRLGSGQAEVNDFAAALEGQRQFNAARRELAAITEEARINEERFALVAESSGLSQAEAERQLVAIRSVSLRQLEELAAKVQALAAATPDNAELQRFAAQLGLQAQQAAVSIDPAVERLRTVSQEAGAAIADSFGAILTGSLSGKDAIRQLDQQLVALILRMAVLEPLARSVANAIMGIGGGSTGQTGGGVSGFLGSVLGALGIGKAGAAAPAVNNPSAFTAGGGGGFLESIASFATSLFAAKGAAFDGGRVQAFARGGIVDRPTMFGFGSGRVGVAGEAGTEGVLPLKRTATGDLGVQVAGGASTPMVYNYSPTFLLQGTVTRQTQQQLAAAALDGAQRGQRVK